MQTEQASIKCTVLLSTKQKTGIAPTRIITEKQLDLTAGMVVTVNWDGEIVKAEILALDGKSGLVNFQRYVAFVLSILQF